MGHTVWSQRQNLDIMIAELQNYGKSLRVEERELYLHLLKQPLKHFGSITYASSMHAWAFLLLSVILEQEKRIKKLEGENAGLVHGRIQERQQNRPLDQDKEW